MIKKETVSKLQRVIDKKKSLAQASNHVREVSQGIGLLFPEPVIGSGYLQWKLPSGIWIPFTSADESQKSLVAFTYNERKELLRQKLGNEDAEKAITFPDDSFLFFKINEENNEVEIAITGWGHKYYGLPPGGQFEGYKETIYYQKVDIAFIWGEDRIPNFEFKINDLERKTEQDGYLHVTGKLKVGETHSIDLATGQHFDLKVERNKQFYEYDISKYASAEIYVTCDSTPIADQTCKMTFNSATYTVKTDAAGHATLKFLLAHDTKGMLAQPMPNCEVVCGHARQEQTPTQEGDNLVFRIDLTKTATADIYVTRDGQPLADQTCTLTYNGKNYTLQTDATGHATQQLTLAYDAAGSLPQPAPPCEVTYDNEQQQQVPQKNGDNMIFNFERTTPEEKPPVVEEPQFVRFRLLDYGGYPMPNMPFSVKLKKKGKVMLQTDSEGYAMVPKDYFTPKEKMKVEFEVTKEYIAAHDLHLSKGQ